MSLLLKEIRNRKFLILNVVVGGGGGGLWEWEAEPPTKFSKNRGGGGLNIPQLLEGVFGVRGG